MGIWGRMLWPSGHTELREWKGGGGLLRQGKVVGWKICMSFTQNIFSYKQRNWGREQWKGFTLLSKGAVGWGPTGEASCSSLPGTSPHCLLFHSLLIDVTPHNPAPCFHEKNDTRKGVHVQKLFTVQETNRRAIFPFILELSPELIKAVINFSRSLHVVFVSDFQCFSCACCINYWNIILFIHPPVTEIGSLKANLALISFVCLAFSPQYCHCF